MKLTLRPYAGFDVVVRLVGVRLFPESYLGSLSSHSIASSPCFLLSKSMIKSHLDSTLSQYVPSLDPSPRRDQSVLVLYLSENNMRENRTAE